MRRRKGREREREREGWRREREREDGVGEEKVVGTLIADDEA